MLRHFPRVVFARSSSELRYNTSILATVFLPLQLRIGQRLEVSFGVNEQIGLQRNVCPIHDLHTLCRRCISVLSKQAFSLFSHFFVYLILEKSKYGTVCLIHILRSYLHFEPFNCRCKFKSKKTVENMAVSIPCASTLYKFDAVAELCSLRSSMKIRQFRIEARAEATFRSLSVASPRYLNFMIVVQQGWNVSVSWAVRVRWLHTTHWWQHNYLRYTLNSNGFRRANANLTEIRGYLSSQTSSKLNWKRLLFKCTSHLSPFERHASVHAELDEMLCKFFNNA